MHLLCSANSMHMVAASAAAAEDPLFPSFQGSIQPAFPPNLPGSPQGPVIG